MTGLHHSLADIKWEEKKLQKSIREAAKRGDMASAKARLLLFLIALIVLTIPGLHCVRSGGRGGRGYK